MLSFLDDRKTIVDWAETLNNLNQMTLSKPYSEAMMKTCLLRFVSHYESAQTEYLRNNTSNEIANFLLSLNTRVDKIAYHKSKLLSAVRKPNETLSSAVQKVRNIAEKIYAPDPEDHMVPAVPAIPLPVLPPVVPIPAIAVPGAAGGAVVPVPDIHPIVNRILINAIIYFTCDEISVPMDSLIKSDSNRNRLKDYNYYLKIAMSAELRVNSPITSPLKYGRELMSPEQISLNSASALPCPPISQIIPISPLSIDYHDPHNFRPDESHFIDPCSVPSSVKNYVKEKVCADLCSIIIKTILKKDPCVNHFIDTSRQRHFDNNPADSPRPSDRDISADCHRSANIHGRRDISADSYRPSILKRRQDISEDSYNYMDRKRNVSADIHRRSNSADMYLTRDRNNHGSRDSSYDKKQHRDISSPNRHSYRSHDRYQGIPVDHPHDKDQRRPLYHSHDRNQDEHRDRSPHDRHLNHSHDRNQHEHRDNSHNRDQWGTSDHSHDGHSHNSHHRNQDKHRDNSQDLYHCGSLYHSHDKDQRRLLDHSHDKDKRRPLYKSHDISLN